MSINLNSINEGYAPVRPQPGIQKAKLSGVEASKEYLDFNFILSNGSETRYRIFPPSKEFVNNDNKLNTRADKDYPFWGMEKGDMFTKDKLYKIHSINKLQQIKHVLNRLYEPDDIDIEFKESWHDLFKDVQKFVENTQPYGYNVYDEVPLELLMLIKKSSDKQFVNIKEYPPFIKREEEDHPSLEAQLHLPHVQKRLDFDKDNNSSNNAGESNSNDEAFDPLDKIGE